MLNHEPMGKSHVSAIKNPDVGWAVIAGKWWVAGLLVLTHMHTPPALHVGRETTTSFFHPCPSSCKESFCFSSRTERSFFPHA